LDGTDWETQAARNAAELSHDLDGLESDFWPARPHGSFRNFWERSSALSQLIRTAPAITLDDKFGLQKRLAELVRRARDDQRQLQLENAAQTAQLRERLALAAESLADATTMSEVQEIRADLALARESISRLGTGFPHADRTAIWEEWQGVNQAAWERLNRLWSENEQRLERILDAAQEQLGRGESRPAKESIQSFHAGMTADACSHRAAKRLRSRANMLWEQANAVARGKHTAYLDTSQERIRAWTQSRLRHQGIRENMRSELARLEEQIQVATTGMASALLQGRIDGLRRDLERLEHEDLELDRRIKAARETLERG